MARMFGTDGVRGIANTELTCKMAYELGQAAAIVLTKGAHKPKLLIGRDTRISGDMLECALVAGICSVGATAVTVGVLPTPGIAYLTRKLGMDAGVVISASHNPVAYNGIKFFDGQGWKLPDALEDEIEALIDKGIQTLPGGAEVGMRQWLPDGAAQYRDFLYKQVNGSFAGMKIVLDCANGASSAIAPELFASLGADVIALHHHPDGHNINDACGSTHPQSMQEKVRQTGADIGLAFDGDADRLLVCDETGTMLDGDVIMGLCALDMKTRGQLKKDTLVVTVMSNIGLERSLREQGISLVKTDVGDRYVVEAMRKGGYNIGGEQSGHVLMTDLSTTGDGMQSALAFVQVVRRDGRKLSEQRRKIRIYPQVLVNAHVHAAHKNNYAAHPAIAAKMAELERAYADNGRVLIRPSGTEHLIRVMIEGPDEQQMYAHARELADLMEQYL